MSYKLVLASASPRRQNLMKEAGLKFRVCTKKVAEVYPDGLAGGQVPEYLARLKAEAFRTSLKRDELLITADTVVLLNGEVLGKPKNRDDALLILQKLAGNKHTVVTGVCLTTREKQESYSVSTDVYFSPLTSEEIVFYVDHYRPFDKAGAYGIQEWIGYIGIERIEGSFYNVMGLPIQSLYQKLKEFGINTCK